MEPNPKKIKCWYPNRETLPNREPLFEELTDFARIVFDPRDRPQDHASNQGATKACRTSHSQ